MTLTPAVPVDRAAALDRFARIRARTRGMFDLLDDAVYYERPIALRNPVVFYEGHLPVFAVNTLVKKALGRPGVDAHFEEIFARGIDPDTEAAAIARGNPAWPSRAAVRAYADAADAAIADAIASAELETSRHPMLERAQALWAILEHEEMHQETLAYMWHEVPYAQKRMPDGYVTTLPLSWSAGRDSAAQVHIPAGLATLGTRAAESPFAWDNELDAHVVPVPAFAIDARNVTNAQFMDFVEAGGYRNPRWWTPEDWAWIGGASIAHPRFWERAQDHWYWRGMFERVALPPSWPVYVTQAEAAAYARWRGLRLPTEAEFHRAAYGTPDGGERAYPWGDSVDGRLPVNCDFARWDPEPVGSRPEGASAFGVHDLVGNGWEWTSTVFAPFAGFAPLPSYPEYSADFFDGEHFVMKGASPCTPRELVRRGFRNWFRSRYPYVYAGFRCAGAA
jgi:gamma-glutamyl hercynylcysteine S-oxide synthase